MKCYKKKATGKGKNGFSYTGQCHIDLIKGGFNYRPKSNNKNT